MPCHLTVEQVKALITYNPQTGEFTSNKTGCLVGNVSAQGYNRIGIGGRSYYGAPLAWYVMTGKWPALTVDHKNTIRDDDSWNNLRLATRSQNIANQGKVAGVYFHKAAGKWAVSIKENGKAKHYGLYTDYDEAVSVAAARHKAIHGEFSFGSNQS